MIDIKKALNNQDLEICSKIRKTVYGDEENAPEALYIIDDLDKIVTTVNFILYVDDIPVCTIRYIKVDNSTVKIQRLATISKYRNRGYASLILNALENDILKSGYNKILLDSSAKAVKFYLKHNYEIVSEIFYEDNRPHQKMVKSLNN